MIQRIIPVLHVESSEVAERFYVDQLGFELCFSYRIDESKDDPRYMGLRRDGAWVHVSSFSGDSVSGAAIYVVVDDVDALWDDFQGRGVRADMEPTDQTWGNREMYVRDPDGNSIRFIQET